MPSNRSYYRHSKVNYNIHIAIDIKSPFCVSPDLNMGICLNTLLHFTVPLSWIMKLRTLIWSVVGDLFKHATTFYGTVVMDNEVTHSELVRGWGFV